MNCLSSARWGDNSFNKITKRSWHPKRATAGFGTAVLEGRFIRWFPWDSKRHLAFFVVGVIFLVSEIWFETCRLWVLWNKNGFLKTNDSAEVPGGCCDAVCIIYFGCLSSYFLDFLSTILPCKEQAHTTTPQPLPSRNQGITKPNSSYWGLFNRSLEVLNLIGCFKG